MRFKNRLKAKQCFGTNHNVIFSQIVYFRWFGAFWFWSFIVDFLRLGYRSTDM